MTPPDKPGSFGQKPEREAERPSAVATDGHALPATQASEGPGEPGGTSDFGGEASVPDTGEPTRRTANSASQEDLELSHSATPPPWQRMSGESSSAATPSTQSNQSPPLTDQPGQRTMPVGQPSGSSGEPTVSVERPVVTGSAASSLFSDGTGLPGSTSTPQTGQGRTTVHLDGGNPAAGAMRVGAAAMPSAVRRPGRGPRRANLQIKRFDPWSVLKLSLVLSVALFFVWLVAVGVLYAVLDGMGVWDKLNGISSEILQPGDEGGGAEPLISAGRVFGVAAIIGAVNIVLFSALATVGAFIYNVSADLAGGLEVTLAERE